MLRGDMQTWAYHLQEYCNLQSIHYNPQSDTLSLCRPIMEFIFATVKKQQ